jgi:chaperonin GroES
MKLRPLGDWVLIELEPEKRKSKGGILMPGPEPVRIARALRVGPGRYNDKGKFVPTEIKPGERFPFFKAVADTGQNKYVGERLPEDQEMIRESDILFVVEGKGDPEISI